MGSPPPPLPSPHSAPTSQPTSTLLPLPPPPLEIPPEPSPSDTAEENGGGIVLVKVRLPSGQAAPPRRFLVTAPLAVLFEFAAQAFAQSLAGGAGAGGVAVGAPLLPFPTSRFDISLSTRFPARTFVLSKDGGEGGDGRSLLDAGIGSEKGVSQEALLLAPLI